MKPSTQSILWRACVGLDYHSLHKIVFVNRTYLRGQRRCDVSFRAVCVDWDPWEGRCAR